MNLIPHICWLLILHLPAYSPASNHAKTSFRLGPDYEYNYGTVPKRKDNRIYHLRGYYTYPPRSKPKVVGNLFDYHSGHLVTSTTPRPPKPPPAYNNNRKPNEYDSNESVNFHWELTTTHLHHHHTNLPQINTEEGYPEHDAVAPKKNVKHIEKIPYYEKDEEGSPEIFPVSAEKSKNHNNLLQYNTEEDYAENIGLSDAPKKSKKKK